MADQTTRMTAAARGEVSREAVTAFVHALGLEPGDVYMLLVRPFDVHATLAARDNEGNKMLTADGERAEYTIARVIR